MHGFFSYYYKMIYKILYTADNIHQLHLVYSESFVILIFSHRIIINPFYILLWRIIIFSSLLSKLEDGDDHISKRILEIFKRNNKYNINNNYHNNLETSQTVIKCSTDFKSHRYL